MQDKPTRKKAVNLTVDAKLLDEAKATGLNLSQVLERALAAELSKGRAERWLERNRTAIEASNAELERNGHWYSPDWLEQ